MTFSSPVATAEFSKFADILNAALQQHHYEKASGGNGIQAEPFQILKDDAIKVLHSICQQFWKTPQWPQDWKRSVFIPIPKKGNAKERSNYHTIALISHASKEKVKVAQSCPTLCDLIDFAVHGILQAGILEWVAFPFSRGSSQHRDQTQISCITGFTS